MNKKIQLFCFPYAGGTAEVFEELTGFLGDEVLVTALEYAGHGRRKSEKFYQDFGELAGDLFGQIKEKRREELPYAVFGYSMGSISAYEVLCRYLRGCPPKHIFLAAHEAPDVDWESKAYARLEDGAFMDMLIGFGGFDESGRKMLDNRFFRRLYFQPIREDYRLLAEYHMEERYLLPADTTVFYSPEDIPDAQIRSWSRFASAGMEYIPLGKNHFFIREHGAEIADVIQKRLV